MGRTLRRLPFVLLLASPAARADDPTGLWWAEGGAAKVAITRCGETLCGRVAWLRSPFDEHGCLLRDEQNPDPSLRDRSLIGIELLRDLRPSDAEPGEWNGGEIYDPTSGRTYSAVLRMEGPDRLRVRGYLGIRLLGRTTTWIRVGAERQCRETARPGLSSPATRARAGPRSPAEPGPSG